MPVHPCSPLQRPRGRPGRGRARRGNGQRRARQARARMNEIQVIGTHNSYHRELSKAERVAHDAIYGGAPIYDGFLAYSHASLPNQFSRQERAASSSISFPDPQGGLYSNPLLRQRLAIGPLTDAEWYRPGIKVLHTEDLDYKSTCIRLTSCLRLVQQWSRANRRHVPLLVLLELKSTDPVAGAGRSPGPALGRRRSRRSRPGDPLGVQARRADHAR